MVRAASVAERRKAAHRIITGPLMHETHNSLSEDIREKSIDLLNNRLADCIDLSTQVKSAHWNVKGPQFIGLHELFDKIYEDITGHSDTIAERCVQLGGTAMGTARIVARDSHLEEYPLDIFTCEDHVQQLSDHLSDFARLCRDAIDTAADAGDQATADVFTEIVRAVDKWVWFVEAHMQEPG